MKNSAFDGAPSQGREPRGGRVLVMAVLLAATWGVAGCSGKTSDDAAVAAVTPTNVTLTADQRKNVRLYTVASAAYHRTVEATGSVDFNNDQATAVLAPISGPVSRVLVDIGDHVKQGDALALVDSPDYAAAV